MKLHYFVVAMFLVLIVQTVNATHQVEYRVPSSMVTTVGQLTTLQVDIKNNGASTEDFLVKIIASSPNIIEITTPTIDIAPLKTGESVSIFSNIRTLTDTPSIVLTIRTYRNSDMSLLHDVSTTVSVSSKKFSLPDFGLFGFLQIMLLASLLYLVNRRK